MQERTRIKTDVTILSEAERSLNIVGKPSLSSENRRGSAPRVITWLVMIPMWVASGLLV